MLLPPQRIVRDGAAVLLTLEAFEEDGEKVCGIYQLTGQIGQRPKRWLQLVREELTRIERIAKRSGCIEIRLGGRDWSRLLKGLGYEPFPDIENGLHKRL